MPIVYTPPAPVIPPPPEQLTASNGIHVENGDIRLGGTPLTANRAIPVGASQLQISLGTKAGNEAVSGSAYKFGSAKTALYKNADESYEVTVNDKTVGNDSTVIVGYRYQSLGNHRRILEIDNLSATFWDDLTQIGLLFGADYTANQLLNKRAITDVGGVTAIVTPFPVDDTLGIFTNDQCNAVAVDANAYLMFLIGATVIYYQIAPGFWVNFLKTDCL